MEETFRLNPRELSQKIKAAGFKLESVTVLAKVKLRREGAALFTDLGVQSVEVVENDLANEVFTVSQPARLMLLVLEDSVGFKLETVGRAPK